MGSKPISCTSRPKGRGNLIYEIAYHTEPGVLGKLLYYSTKSELCGIGHRVGLIQDYDFKSLCPDLLCGCEGLYLIPNNINPAIIRGVQLKSHCLVLRAVQLPCCN